jgi:hypothetical protein
MEHGGRVLREHNGFALNWFPSDSWIEAVFVQARFWEGSSTLMGPAQLFLAEMPIRRVMIAACTIERGPSSARQRAIVNILGAFHVVGG